MSDSTAVYGLVTIWYFTDTFKLLLERTKLAQLFIYFSYVQPKTKKNYIKNMNTEIISWKLSENVLHKKKNIKISWYFYRKQASKYNLSKYIERPKKAQMLLYANEFARTCWLYSHWINRLSHKYEETF